MSINDKNLLYDITYILKSKKDGRNFHMRLIRRFNREHFQDLEKKINFLTYIKI